MKQKTEAEEEIDQAILKTFAAYLSTLDDQGKKEMKQALTAIVRERTKNLFLSKTKQAGQCT
jgi:hypothetical protein